MSVSVCVILELPKSCVVPTPPRIFLSTSIQADKIQVLEGCHSIVITWWWKLYVNVVIPLMVI